MSSATEQSVATGIPLERVVDTIVRPIEDPNPLTRYELHNNFLRDVVLMRVVSTSQRESLVRKLLALEFDANAVR